MKNSIKLVMLMFFVVASCANSIVRPIDTSLEPQPNVLRRSTDEPTEDDRETQERFQAAMKALVSSASLYQIPNQPFWILNIQNRNYFFCEKNNCYELHKDNGNVKIGEYKETYFTRDADTFSTWGLRIFDDSKETKVICDDQEVLLQNINANTKNWNDLSFFKLPKVWQISQVVRFPDNKLLAIAYNTYATNTSEHRLYYGVQGDLQLFALTGYKKVSEGDEIFRTPIGSFVNKWSQMEGTSSVTYTDPNNKVTYGSALNEWEAGRRDWLAPLAGPSVMKDLASPVLRSPCEIFAKKKGKSARKR